MFTAYLLTSTISVLLFGKVSDIYGRRQVFQVTIVIFLIGSVLSGLSPSMTQLILSRGIQGIGGGGLLAMSFTILGDILSPRQRPKSMGYFTGVFAAASVIGPLVTAKYLLCPGTLSGAEGRITALPLADGDPLISSIVNVLQIDVSLAEGRPSRCPARTKCGQEVLFQRNVVSLELMGFGRSGQCQRG